MGSNWLEGARSGYFTVNESRPALLISPAGFRVKLPEGAGKGYFWSQWVRLPQPLSLISPALS
jgi:hypothetical protein